MQETIELIEHTIKQYRNELGKDFLKYKNHVYRVYSLCLEFDDSASNNEKYAIASIFHDLGIWTAQSFDYLEPSIALVTKYLKTSGRVGLTKEITLMIDMHHKRSRYKGEYEKTVEIFRRADWIDVTRGLKTFGLSKSKYTIIQNRYPNLGFHRFLVKQTVKNFIKSPTNPLPMFKK